MVLQHRAAPPPPPGEIFGSVIRGPTGRRMPPPMRQPSPEPIQDLARRQFASSVDEPERRSLVPSWAVSIVAAVTMFCPPACGSVLGLAMLLTTAGMPAAWSVLTALIWTGAAAGGLVWLLRRRG